MLCGGLDGKAGAHTSRVGSAASAATTVSIDVAESVAAVVTSRPQPPPHRRGHGGMIIGYSTVTSLVILILLLTVLLILVCIVPGSEHLKLGQQEKIVRRAGYVTGTVTVVASIISVLGHRLQHHAEVIGQSCHQTVRQRAFRSIGVAQNSFPHIRIVPATTIGIADIHTECYRAARAVILRITQRHGLPADFANLEVDAVASLFTGVVVEAQDENIDIDFFPLKYCLRVWFSAICII